MSEHATSEEVQSDEAKEGGGAETGITQKKGLDFV